MPTPLEWSVGAEDDLSQIYEFIARDSLRYAEVVVRALLDAPARLREYPLSGRVVPELQRDDVREVIWETYRVVYQVAPEKVTILTVFRATRLLPPIRLNSDPSASSPPVP